MLLKIAITLKIICQFFFKYIFENSTDLSFENITNNLDLFQCFGNGDNKENDFGRFNFEIGRLILYDVCMQHCKMKG